MKAYLVGVTEKGPKRQQNDNAMLYYDVSRDVASKDAMPAEIAIDGDTCHFVALLDGCGDRGYGLKAANYTVTLLIDSLRRSYKQTDAVGGVFSNALVDINRCF